MKTLAQCRREELESLAEDVDAAWAAYQAACNEDGREYLKAWRKYEALDRAYTQLAKDGW